MKIESGILHEVPTDIEAALIVDTSLLERWNKLTPIQRNEWICWVTIVKKTETREEHILRLSNDVKEGKKQPCCWPGCPHRRPKAQKWFSKKQDTDCPIQK
ncbi:MAG TPA: YdeI/OmpD-associated family protein [Niabella sp.]|nr:YdeI/OmpD-associated family protein [Niabella sp.]HOZ97406.1 YdeI/OmpD-associated family protein [Niabella sp.]HQW15226.1 YdeI/OmpD-associated family protein [Niabella sp.]HQX20306.1 YdeI/OmpD-associated family protein [Niabella sp.]HQX42300.1 YdeI/OmpD-associated family protein [Niabella sp.]